VDINNDGKIDLVAGDTEGNVWIYQNIGTKTEPRLAAGVRMEAGGKLIHGTSQKIERGPDGQYHTVPQPDAIMGTYSKLHVADWDGDGLLDILIGQDSPRNDEEQILLYRNIGTPTEMKLAAPWPLNIIKGQVSRPSPVVVDWDGDGKRDVLLGSEGNQVFFLRNIGTNEKPVFAAPEPIVLPGFDPNCCRCRIAVTDWNNDGKLDLLVGTFYSTSNAPDGKGMGGNVWLFLRK
jgi:hypothetical protein